MGDADGEGQEKEDSLVHKRLKVNEPLVKANPHSAQKRRHEIKVKTANSARRAPSSCESTRAFVHLRKKVRVKGALQLLINRYG